MAKAALLHKKTTTETLKFSGVVSEDGLYITLDGMKTPTANLFKKFANQIIDGTLQQKNEEDIEE